MDEDEIKIINSKGGHVLLYAGYRFHKHVTNKNNTTLWRCENYKTTKLKCTGSVTINSEQTTIIKNKPHCNICRPDLASNSIENTLRGVCDEAAKGKEPAPRVYKRGLAFIESKGWHFATNKPVPSFNEKKSGIYRQRNKLAEVQKIRANTVEAVEIPVQYKYFLMADYSDNKYRIIVFSSQDARKQLEKLNNYFMDGTYQACPVPFRQIFIIYGDVGSDSDSTNIFPLVYVFMSHQTSEAYTILFNIIKSQIPTWHPKTVTTDFEKALMLALSKIPFTRVEMSGCHYHFCNAIIRKAKALGIKKTKHNRRIVTLCTKLPLLPENCIEEGWNYIKKEIMPDNDLNKFVNYFENNWMKDEYYKIWCVYGLRHRTNNAAEGWNHNLNTNINKNEVQFSQILHILQQESSITSLNCNRLERFNKSSCKRRKSSIESDNCILFAQMQLVNGDINVSHFLDKLR